MAATDVLDVYYRRLSYSALRYLPGFLFQTPRRVLLWMALPQIALVLLLWFAADDETLFFPIGAGWMLGLSLLLALLVSHRLRQPHHLWAGCHVVVLLLLLAHMGIFSIIGAMPIRHSRWRKKRCYEKSIRLMTAFFKSFDVASHAAAKRRGLVDE